MTSKKYVSLFTSVALIASLAVALPALADTVSPTAPASTQGGWQGRMPGKGMMNRGQGGSMMRPVVFGTVASINGSTITLNARKGFGSTTPTTTFTIDATNATITKNNATSSISSIVAGDMISVVGTIHGTSVTATMIRDGQFPAPGMKPGMGNRKIGTSTPVLGNGQPIVAGKITSISGSSVSITNASNVVYTVDASSAKILTGKTASSLSNLTVGDSVVVQGTINGNSVVASTIMDQAKPANPGNRPQANRGFFGGIAQFFGHLFGF